MRAKPILTQFLLYLLLLMTICPTATSKIIYVDDDAFGANDGTSWENAYAFLQDALSDANDSDKPVEIRVAQGVYKPDQGAEQTPGDKDATFQLINGVTLKGGFAGLSEPDPNERDVELYETILSGDLGDDDPDVNDLKVLRDAIHGNSETVVTGNNIDSTAVLDGFTITGGYWNGPICGMIGRDGRSTGTVTGGAGMNNSAASPTIIQCTFTRNSTDRSGAAIYNANGSSPTVISCTFTSNYSEGSGAAMANNNNSNPNVTDCTFSDNLVYNGEGGGMANYNSSPVLTNCSFVENSAYSGGAMYNKDSNSVLNTCEFIGNTASRAGAISNDAGQLIVDGCIFDKNYEGAIRDYSEICSIFTNCKFRGNSTSFIGGAVYTYNATFTRCIFAGNRSIGDYNMSGAVFHIYTAEFNNCTFANNWAKYGSSIYGFGILYVNNCIFRGPGDQIYVDGDGVPMFVDYSNIQGGWAWPGKGNIDADPCFVDPGYWADADDLNIVAEPNNPNAVWVKGDYHLKSQAGRWDPAIETWVFDDVTSPCIDTGNPNSPIGAEPEPNGGIINMGAYGGAPEASMSPSGLHAIYGGGVGTPSHPYLIYTAEQLNTIGTEPNDLDKHFKLMADIDMSTYSGTDFNIIGQSYENPFNGHIDGNGHTVSNFTFADSSGRAIGLIGFLGTLGSVKNLILTDADLEGQSYVGSIVGYSRGIVQNCRVIRGKVQALDYTGGIVGISIGAGLITECYADVNVSGLYGTGGIVGANSGSNISFCSATGSVAGCETTGGITGRQDNNSVIHDCQSACLVSGTYRAIGGLIGSNYSDTVLRCYSTGIVTGTGSADGIGGLVGENSVYSSSDTKGTISQCFSSGDVSGFSNVGGLVGINCGTITDCYATGSVNGECTAGGLVGRNSYFYGQEVYPGNIYNCYSTGGVSGDLHVGGLTGYSYAGEIVSSFWDIETSGWITSDGGTGKSTVEMQMAGTFINIGWDFVGQTTNGTEDIWWIDEGLDYPRLWWETTGQ